MSLTLVVLMVFTWWVVWRTHGPFSLVAVATLTLTIYSIPAMLQLAFPFELQEGNNQVSLAATTPIATLATIVAWVAVLIVFAWPGRRRQVPSTMVARNAGIGGQDWFTPATLVLCLAGYGILSVTEGPLFFLNERNVQSDNTISLLWRWVNAIGLISAVLHRRWAMAMVFVAAVLMYFVAGDRTVVVIVAFALAVATLRGKPFFGTIIRPSVLLTMVAFGCVAFFGKPIYLAAKAGSLAPLQQALTAEWVYNTLSTFEPFLTFNILHLVVLYDFEMSLFALLQGVAGQLLIIPSIFGVDSNRFNVEFSSIFASALTYGIAGNFWAQAWSVGGPFAVGIFGVIYAGAVRCCESRAMRSVGALKVGLILVGSLVAVYAHRNSLDNLLSFVRQIVIVIAAAALIATLLRVMFGRRPAGRIDWRVPRKSVSRGPLSNPGRARP